MLSRILAEVLILGIRIALAWLVVYEAGTVAAGKLEEVARALGNM